MRRMLLVAAVMVLVPLTASSQAPPFQDQLLDHMAGKWLLRGTIEGKATTHDVTADWVLGHLYLRIHEVSREKDAKGAPAYEAIVLIGWDAKLGEYDCLWLDTTGGGGLAPGAVIGRGKREGDTIPFVFKVSDTSRFRNTFVYDKAANKWQWNMDGEEGGKLQPFARLTLTRATR